MDVSPKAAKEKILTIYRQSEYYRYRNDNGSISLKKAFQLYKKHIFYGFLGLIGLLLLITLGTYIYFARDVINKQALVNYNNTGLTLMDRNGKPFFTFNQPKAISYTNISNIPTSVQQAAIAAEDRNFYNEPGFSISGIFRAFLVDVTGGRLSQGGSTITQELVKNALLNSNKNFLRKWQELVLAIEIERIYSKKDILEMYLNEVYFGEGAFGIQNAAQTYFGENANQLDLAQSALLIGLLPAPSAYSPLSNNPSIAMAKQHQVLSDMLESGYITQTQAQAAESEKLTYAPPQKDNTVNQLAPHFALYVKNLLDQKYGADNVIRSGYRVTTTLNSTWQQYAEQTVKNQVTYLNADDASNGAAVAIDPKTGQILVMVGSYDWNNNKFGKANMAITPRQPGSSFKPVVYSYALGQHMITPATILHDVKTTFPGNYTPHDYDYSYRGPVTVRRALANSLNIPAVEVMQRVGVANALQQAQTLGITTLGNDPSKYGLSLVLGAGEVPLVQMTNMYAVFADQGTYNPPVAILKITDKYGNVVYTNDEQPQQNVIDPGVAFLISSILSDNQARAEEFGNALTITRTAAVKTGTTSDFKDAWTIGYTPSLVVGVWVGNNNDKPMNSVAGSLGAAPIWRLMMEDYLIGAPVEQFQQPSDVVKAQVCPYGLPNPTPTPGGNNNQQPTPTPSGSPQTPKSIFTEYFLQGTQPQKGCQMPTPTPKPSGTPTPTPSETPTPTPTQQPTNTPIPTDTPSPTSSISLPPNPVSPTL